jgi:predicted transcriptional regulator
MTSTTERDEQGRFSPEHADADVLVAVRNHNPAATSEVADDLGIARQSADYRLRKLAEEGQVHRKKIGASAMWTPVKDGGTA